MIDDDTAMRSLVTCDHCSHGASLHGSDGCQVFRCRCQRAKGHVVEDALDGARREQTAIWAEAMGR
jgi:hypothetical protein